MSRAPDLRLTELLTARLCHELIGPLAAVENGVELLLDQDHDLAEEQDHDLAEKELALVAESAHRTSSRLQFYRFAYGFGGSSIGAGQIAGPPPCELAARYFASTKITCHYRDHTRLLDLAQQKLGCNLLLIGSEALARGGTLILDTAGPGLELEMAGEVVQLAPAQIEALSLATPIELLTPRTVQAYYTGLLAQALGWRLAVRIVELGKRHICSAAPVC